jgi:hypothetical protein
MRHYTSPRIESMIDWIIQKVGKTWHVDISKSKKSSREICRVMVSPKDTAKLFVENTLDLLPENKNQNGYYSWNSDIQDRFLPISSVRLLHRNKCTHMKIHSLSCSSQLEYRAPFGASVITHTKTHGRTSLDEWSACRRDLYLHRTTQHTNTRDKHPCPGWDSNPRSQQPSGHRPMP